jgi:hypothetical protein
MGSLSGDHSVIYIYAELQRYSITLLSGFGPMYMARSMMLFEISCLTLNDRRLLDLINILSFFKGAHELIISITIKPCTDDILLDCFPLKYHRDSSLLQLSAIR